MTNWEEQIELPIKDSNTVYAYIKKSDDKVVKCDREKLFEVLEKSYKEIKYIATPNNETFIIPGTDYEKLQPILRKKKEEIIWDLFKGLVAVVFFGGLMFLFNMNSDESLWSDTSGKINVLIFGIIPILNGLYEFIYIKRVNKNNFLKESAEIKFNFWVKQNNDLSIFIITGILVLITLIQFITGLNDSIELAGLVKAKTIGGEYWRLLTCTLLHGSIMHILFNGAAIFVIGSMVIRISGLSYFAIVFLLSGLLGSLFSLFFMPMETSVGASGGIMGLIGFILIVSIKFHDNIPRNIIKSILNTIILVAIIGVSASEVIDNAAHAGGLIGGLLIGLILIRKRKNLIPYRPTVLINILGVISILILIGGIGAIFKQL